MTTLVCDDCASRAHCLGTGYVVTGVRPHPTERGQVVDERVFCGCGCVDHDLWEVPF